MSSSNDGVVTQGESVSLAAALPVYTVPQIADQLTNGFFVSMGSTSGEWAQDAITFNVSDLSGARANLARLAFATWADVCNLSFVETTGTADITLQDNSAGAFASYGISGGNIHSATVNVDDDWFGGSNAIDGYTFQTFIHEIGHALGLGHAGNYNGSATYGVDNHYANDSWQLSIMSYFNQQEAGTGSFAWVLTPQMADILAVQNLYGAATTRTGDTVYGFNSNVTGAAAVLYNISNFSTNPVALTLYDSGGTDTLDLSGYSSNQRIDIRGGQFSDAGGLVNNIGIYTTTVIENAIGGSGNDSITGNQAGNRLTGGLGSDLINGGDGTDRAILGGLSGAGHQIMQYQGVVYAFNFANHSRDTITNVEQFADGGQWIASVAVRVFDPAAYAASYNDLALAFGNAAQVAANHYINFGAFEGREITFDAAQYLENYADLAAAFGSNIASATQHFLAWGVGEHRLAEDPLEYIASYVDLMDAFDGRSLADTINSGLRHYAGSGFSEGRRLGIDFDADQYLENYSDLRSAFGTDPSLAAFHYINSGRFEHRLAEDPLAYIASSPDLIQAFGSLRLTQSQLEDRGLAHFHAWGANEGRQTDFDVDQYLANYADLRAAFGDGQGGYDTDLATWHYINAGFSEGRSDDFIV